MLWQALFVRGEVPRGQNWAYFQGLNSYAHL